MGVPCVVELFAQANSQFDFQIHGKITQTKYRGALLDYVITLDKGKKVTATLLQNKKEGIYEYKI